MQDKRAKLSTPFGEVYANVLDAKRVHFENDPGFNGGADALAFEVNGVPLKLSVIVSIDEEGSALICENQYDKGVGIDDPRLVGHFDVRRSDKGRRWRPVKASIAARKRLIAVFLPLLVEATRKLRTDRAVKGIAVFRNEAKHGREQAETYRINAVKCDVQAAHCEALADDLERSTAWAVEAVAEARPDQEVR